MMKYLEVWEKVFTFDYKDSCKNTLHIIELLLKTPTTNAKLANVQLNEPRKNGLA